MNPYWGLNGLEFFCTFFSRLFRGDCFVAPVSDEIQMAVLSCIAISCAVLGPFLVLKKMTMFVNALAHTTLLGIAVSFLLLGIPTALGLSHLLIGALVAALLTALLTEGLTRWFSLSEDASISLSFTALFALGILLITLFTRDLHLGVETIMGNADALQLQDLRISALLALCNVSLILLFFRLLQLSCFDREFAQMLGFRQGMIHFALLFLASATCIGSFRAVGVILVLGFLIVPYQIIRLFCSNLFLILIGGSLIGIGAAGVGTALARHLLSVYGLALSTGGLVMVLLGFGYIGALIFKRTSQRSPNLVS